MYRGDNNKGNPNYEQMLLLTGCDNKINANLNAPNYGIVYDSRLHLFYIDWPTALCNNYNNNKKSSNLIVLPNARYCSDTIRNKLSQLKNVTLAVNYYNRNCVPLTVNLMLNKKLINNKLYYLTKIVDKCQYYRADLSPPLTPVLTTKFLCNYGVTLQVESDSRRFKNVFCALENGMEPSRIRRYLQGGEGGRFPVPSLYFLFNPNYKSGNKLFYSSTEIAKKQNCQSKVRSYADMEICEIKNCITPNYFLPISANRCPIINSFNKLINITFVGVDYYVLKENLYQYFPNIESKKSRVNLSNNSYFYFQFEQYDTPEKSTLYINSTSNQSIHQLNQFKTMMENKYSNIQQIFIQNVYNVFDGRLCLQLNKIFQMTNKNTEFLNTLGDSKTWCGSSNINATGTANCNATVYSIITDNPELKIFKPNNQIINGTSILFLYNSSILIYVSCGNDSTATGVGKIVQPDQFSAVEGYITKIVIPVSIAGLLVTIFNYCCLKEMHTLPSCVVLEMCVWLLVWYVGFLALALVDGAKFNCVWLAMVTHISLLQFLCWMAIVTIMSAMTFGGIGKMEANMPYSNASKVCCKLLVLNVVVLVPVLIVCLPAIINYSCGSQPCITVLPVTYNAWPKCWLHGDLSIYYGISAPGLILSAIGLLSFIYALIGYYRSVYRSKNIRTAKLGNSNQTDNQVGRLFLMFAIKLGILSGVTMGAIKICAVLNWVNVGLVLSVINSSLGLLIMILFGCNKRIIYLWQKKIRKMKQGNCNDSGNKINKASTNNNEDKYTCSSTYTS